MILGQNAFRIHGCNPEGIEFGISHLTKLDGQDHLRNTFDGVDFSMGYGMLRVRNEVLLMQAHLLRPALYDAAGNTLDFGKPHQLTYHSTLIADLEALVRRPVQAFARYGRWQPKTHYTVDGYNGSIVSTNPVSLFSLGLNYKFNDHLRVKFEYTDSLGTETQEYYFDKKSEWRKWSWPFEMDNRLNKLARWLAVVLWLMQNSLAQAEAANPRSIGAGQPQTDCNGCHKELPPLKDDSSFNTQTIQLLGRGSSGMALRCAPPVTIRTKGIPCLDQGLSESIPRSPITNRATCKGRRIVKICPHTLGFAAIFKSDHLRNAGLLNEASLWWGPCQMVPLTGML